MHLLHPRNTLIQPPIHSRSNRQRPTNNSTNTRQKPGESLLFRFTVDDLHGRDVVVEKHAGDTALRVNALLVALRGVVATHQRALVRGHRVLVRFDTGVVAVGETVRAQRRAFVGAVHGGGEEGVPAEGEVGG